MTHTDTLSPAEDAYAVFDRSFDRLASTADPINERIRQAFAAGYEAGRRAERAQGDD